MPRLISRLVLTILAAPLSLFLGILSMFILAEGMDLKEEISALISVSGGAWSFVLFNTIIWFKVVRWTPRRRMLSIVTILPAIILAIFLALFMTVGIRREGPVYGALGNCIIALLALMILVRLWQEKPAERFARLRAAGPGAVLCPQCKYDMSGLTNLTCPECGQSHTLASVNDAHQRALSSPDLAA